MMPHRPSKYHGEQAHVPDVTPIHSGNHTHFPATPAQNARTRDEQRATPPDLHRTKPEHKNSSDLPPPYFPWPSSKDGRAFDSDSTRKGNTYGADDCATSRVPFSSSSKPEPSTTDCAAFSFSDLGTGPRQPKAAKPENGTTEKKKYSPPILAPGWEPKAHLQPKPDSAFIYTGDETKWRLKWPASLKNYIARSFEDVLSEEFDAIYRELHAVILEAVQDQLHLCLDWDQMPLPSTFQHDARVAKLRKLKEEIAELDEMQRLEDEANKRRWIDNKIKRELQEGQDKVKIQRRSGEEVKLQKIKISAASNVPDKDMGEDGKGYQSHDHHRTHTDVGHTGRKVTVKRASNFDCPSEVSADLSEADCSENGSEIFFQLQEGEHQHDAEDTGSTSSWDFMNDNKGSYRESVFPQDSVSLVGSHINGSGRVHHVEGQNPEDRMDLCEQQRVSVLRPTGEPIAGGLISQDDCGFSSGNQLGSWGATSHRGNRLEAGPTHRCGQDVASSSKGSLSGVFNPPRPISPEQNFRRAQEFYGQTMDAPNPAMCISAHAIDRTSSGTLMESIHSNPAMCISAHAIDRTSRGTLMESIHSNPAMRTSAHVMDRTSSGTLMESIHSSPAPHRQLERAYQTRDTRYGARVSPYTGDAPHNSRSRAIYSGRFTHSPQSFSTQGTGRQSHQGGGNRHTHYDNNNRDRNEFRGSGTQFCEGFDPRNSGNIEWASGSQQPTGSSRFSASEEYYPHEYGGYYPRPGWISNSPSRVQNMQEQSESYHLERGHPHEYSHRFELDMQDTLEGDWDEAF